MPVENIGRYQIIGELGKGAMGVVYKATDPNIGRIVALKTRRLDLEGQEAEELLARFKNEARAAGVLNHPHIVTIYDAGEAAGMFYIAMEFIEGETLQQVLKRERMLSPDKAIDIACQVCSGLDFAHSKGIIHRDVKPANIMLLPDGTAKIMDFGIAKSAGSGMTSTGQVLGTPNYMSPEQVKGQPLDGRSDLFSVGVLLYEMLTGERPFAGQNITTIIYKIVNEQPPAPQALDPTVHPGLSAAVMKALAKAPDERYQDGVALVRDLQNYESLAAAAEAPTRPLEPVDATVAATPAAVAAAAHSTAGAAAMPAPSSKLQTTAAPKTAPVVVVKRSGAMTAMIVALALVVLAAGGYFGARSMRLRARQQAGVETATQPVPPENKPEAPPAEAAPGAETASMGTPETGDLHVVSSPPGAQVRIDGRSDPKWLTPFTAGKLTPGAHTISFEKDGYKPETRTVEVAAGKKASASAELRALKGFIAITSSPPGAAVLVDGVPTGQFTPAKLSVDPGQHRVALRRPGFQPLIALTDVGAGQTLSLTPVLKPRPGTNAGQTATGAEQAGGANPFRRFKRWFGGNPQDKGVLEIRTRPRGAEIWVNDTLAPVRTPVKVPVPPGKYRITLRLPGFKPVVRNIDVEKGKSYGIAEILEKQ